MNTNSISRKLNHPSELSPVTTIGDVTASIENQIDVIEKRLGELADKVSYVLRPCEPTSPTSGPPNPPSCGNSQLALSMGVIYNRLVNFEFKLIQIVDRVER